MTVRIDTKTGADSGIPDCKIHVQFCGYCEGQNELSRSTCIQCGMKLDPCPCPCMKKK